MAITIQTTTDIDVTSKQRELVQEALGPDGVYIRMKETLLELVEDGDGLKNPEKTKIIAETIANMSINITSSAMSGGLQWANAEKDLELRKLELEYQLGILEQQEQLAENQVADNLASRQLKQAQLLREYGTPTKDVDSNVVLLGQDGSKYFNDLNVQQDTTNKEDLNTQILSQTEEVQARTHRTVADTYVNHGIFTWTDISDTGITGVAKTATGYTTLSELNKEVAREQAKGYTYNAWSNAATSSGGMIGTLIAAEIPNLDPTTYLNTWQTAVNKLNSLVAPSISI